jgi:hypothetical protein
MTLPDRVFRWERDVPAGWQDELDRAFPRHEHVSWLKLVWIPGTPDAPVQRWGIYQMVPLAKTTPYVLEEPPVWRPNGFTHDRPAFYYPGMVPWQQKLVRETGQFGMLYWIIQGTKGGHRWMLNETEIGISQAQGRGGDTPRPGKLPYAEFDRRVLAKVALMDRMAQYTGIVAFYDRNPSQLDAEDRESVREMREAMWQWLDSQVEQVVDENKAEWRAWAEQAPRREKEPDYEALEESYLNAPV